MELCLLVPASCAGPQKKHQNGLPEPFPGASRGLPGTSWEGQDGPKRRQERPKHRPSKQPLATTPGFKKVVGGVAPLGVLYNPPTTACGNERV